MMNTKLMVFVMMLVLCGFSALALTSVAVISPTSFQNVSGNLVLNATTVGSESNATNVTFYFYGATTGTLAYNVTVYNESEMDVDFNITINTSSVLSDGIYNLTVNASNLSNSVINISVVMVTIDNTAPNVSAINNPTAGYNTTNTGMLILNATVEDRTIGVQTVNFNVTNGSTPLVYTASNAAQSFWNVTINLSTLAQGVHVITVLANDSLGNLNNSVTKTFITDGTAPTVTLITANNSNFSTTTPIIGFNFTDAVYTVASCVIYIDGSASGANASTANATYTNITVSALSQGTHAYYTNCTDGSGKVGQSLTNNLIIDSMPPAVTVNNPTAGYNTTNSGMLILNATVTDVTFSVNTVNFNVTNGTIPLTFTASNVSATYWNVTINLSTLAQGVHVITVLANDTLNNLNNSVTRTFITDGTAPTVTLITGNNTNTSGTPGIAFNFTDAVYTVASCTLYFNGTAYGVNSSTANGSVSTTISANATLANGNWNYNVTCTDGSNNTGVSALNTLRVDTTYPVSTINSVNTRTTTANWTNNRNLTINFTATDTYIVNWTLSVYNSTAGLLKNWTAATSNTSLANYYNTTADGNYTVNLTTIDYSSNSNTTTFLIRMDTVSPVVSSIASSGVTTTGATLTVNATDAASGIVNCTYSGAGSGSLTLSSGLYTASLSSLSAGWSYTATVVCTDNAMNTQTNTTSFTTTAVASTSSSSGGSGPMGTAGGISQGTATMEKKVWTSVNAGETATVEVSHAAEIGVTAVEFVAEQKMYGAWMQVAQKGTLPSTVSSVGGKVYRYIEVSKSSSVKDEKIKDAKIKFKVEKSWLDENKVTKENVALLRYNGGEWKELETVVKDEDGSYVNFEATTPGFSYFAIGQKGVAVAAAPTTSAEATTAPKLDTTETAPATEVTPEPKTTTGSGSLTWLWIVIGIIVIIAIIGIYSYGKK